MTQLKDVIWSIAGFEDLRKYCQKNNDFLREVANLFAERSKLEQTYSDGLLKIGTKARKICGDSLGTLKAAWEGFSAETDHEAVTHRDLATVLLEDLSKPLKTFADTQKEGRKNAEQSVDKATKVLAEKRAKEIQSKKNSFTKSKESESLTTQLESSREKMISEKELSKLDSKCKKAEEAVTKSDNDYITKLIEGERARLELSSTLKSACLVIETLEKEKVEYFKNMLHTYADSLLKTIPRRDEIYKTMDSHASSVSIASDVDTLIKTRGTPPQPAEQLMFSCYEQELSNPMDSVRRRIALERKYGVLLKALESEQKARKGLDNLLNVYSATPSFSDQGTHQDVDSQLVNANAVIDCLEASLHQLSVSLSKHGGFQCPSHRLQSYIEERKDKQGVTSFTLRVPAGLPPYSPDNIDGFGAASAPHLSMNRGPALSAADEYDDYDADEFDDVQDIPPGYSEIETCLVDFDYDAVERDELSVRAGDVITIITKHDDGWWKGELGGRVGLFPASYVHLL